MAVLRPMRIGVGTTVEGRISFIRRFHVKDGSVKCQPGQRHRIRCAEGMLDPEVGVIRVRDKYDQVIGLLVNFACHATHHGGDTLITVGFPVRLAAGLKEAYGAERAVVFLNGAFGNVHHANCLDPNHVDDTARMGQLLAQDVQRVVAGLTTSDRGSVSARSVILNVPPRDPDGPHGAGMKFRQPLGSEEMYAGEARKLRALYARDRCVPAEVQCLLIGPSAALVGIPGECFTAESLRIKMASALSHTFVVGQANGELGYIPSRRYFDGGGYETTLGGWSKPHEDAADTLAEAAVDQLGRRNHATL